MGELQRFLPNTILRLMEQIQIDVPVWSLAKNGIFSTKSFQRLFIPKHATSSLIPLKKIWGFKGPLRPSVTIWTTLHGALPTAELLWRRGIPDSPSCSVCPLHVLRDCPGATAIWRKILSVECAKFVQALNLESWLCSNLYSRRNFLSFRDYWPYAFRQVVHDLWDNFNARNHHNHHTSRFLEDPYIFAKRSLLKVIDLLLAWE